jgi:FkbM family methyltransferase
MNLTAVWKPWYVYRPHQLARRLVSSIAAPPPGHQLMPVSWGVELWADPTEHVGRSIYTTGVFDLAVSEVLFRLVEPDDLSIDAGANLGYMSLIAAIRSGVGGRVMAFEPNPHVAKWFRKNIEQAREQYDMAPVELRATALGAAPGTATLVLPETSAANDGLAHIADAHQPPVGGGNVVRVSVDTVDRLVGARTAGVMKIDVEGYEEQVLDGAAQALRTHRIRHVVFEDHHGAGSKAMSLLRAAGYEILSIGWSMRGPVLAPAVNGSLATAFEAPSYLATIDGRAARDACAPAGWRALQRQTRAVEGAVSR